MFLSDLSIKRPVFATVIMLTLVVLGVFSYNRLSVEEFPNVDIPVISVVTKYEGASAQTVETEVSKKIEEAVNPVAGVKKIYSYSSEGVSTVVVEFELEVDIDAVNPEVRAKISAIRSDLPDDIEEPVIQKIDFNDMPIVSVAAESKVLSPRELTDVVDKVVKKRLESIQGVGKVNLIGSSEKEVNVVIDPLKLESLGVSIKSVMDGIKQENVNTPLGRMTKKSGEYSVRVSGKSEYVDELNNLTVTSLDGRAVRLSEVADIVDGIEEKRTTSLYNGNPAVSLDVIKQSGANVVQVVDDVLDRVQKIEKDMPADVKLTIVRDASQQIRDSLEDVQHTIIIGGILTVLIVFLFINSWRSTVITGLTLPISVISSFIAIYALGMSLNVMTLMALSLAIGMLIDDAIVVRENIVRHVEMGKDHMTAAKEGTAEIGLAVMATTLSVMAVFIPVAFMKGIVGKFFFSFGMTVAFAVAVSLLVSFTLDPMLSSRWHDPAIGNPQGTWLGRQVHKFNLFFDRIADSYKGAVRWALNHRITISVVTSLAFFLGLFLFGTLEGAFMTEEDKGEFQISFTTAPDASIYESENRLNAMLAAVKDVPEVDHTYGTIGAGDNGVVRKGVLYVKLKSKDNRDRSQKEIEQDFRKRFTGVAGVRTSIEEAGGLGSSNKPLVVTIQGSDIDLLKKYSAEMKDKMSQIKGIVDIDTSLEDDTPEYRIKVDRDKAAAVGLNSQDVVNTVSALFGGTVASTYEESDGDAVDIRVRLGEKYRQNPEQLMNLKLAVQSKDGVNTLVTLRNIASYEVDTTPSQINRQDLERKVDVMANLDDLPIGTAVNLVKADVIPTIKTDPGYEFSFAGEGEDMAESFGYMAEALILAVLMVYLVLAAQFESFIEPFAIMFSLPLSILGMAGMLHLTGDTINIMSLIGLIMLMGLVTKNAILLIDYAKHLRAAGMERTEALIQAGRTRFRPIMMTTLAMIFGMLPLALAIGAGAEMRAPMARAVIGGLITSTILTLVVVPVVYTLLDDFAVRLKKFFGFGGHA
ncbi:efflux RND transporter permease subunit [Seleniivibrio sp.]|uniref:efflux RND transporter permease subunit n=1 Tax=Seleniivibrio sp. TaxID=2898801 RepID=UPI0025D676BF|nr:efflux RND transporter permease subunit [Seleniivibrio sp.]MCD8552826.1 efflux RND transporter permease subunit [Seleniivibrio sp.]